MSDGVSEETVRSLETTSREVRHEVIAMSRPPTPWGHPGASLGMADLLTALVFHEVRLDPTRPERPERHRLLVCDPRAGSALYAALALKGFRPRWPSVARGTRPGEESEPPPPGFPGLPEALGSQGVGLAVGTALASRLSPHPFRTYLVIGETEGRLGSTWEALMVAGHYRLSDLLVVLPRSAPDPPDGSGVGLGVEPLREKLEAFRFRAREVDGHDPRGILGALAEARHVRDRPTAVIARIVRGKGVARFEGRSPDAEASPSPDELERALAELRSGPGAGS